MNRQLLIPSLLLLIAVTTFIMHRAEACLLKDTDCQLNQNRAALSQKIVQMQTPANDTSSDSETAKDNSIPTYPISKGRIAENGIPLGSLLTATNKSIPQLLRNLNTPLTLTTPSNAQTNQNTNKLNNQLNKEVTKELPEALPIIQYR